MCIRDRFYAARRGFDNLVFAGFSFAAAAQATIQDDPNPRVRCHLAHIRPDVNMGNLLKDTPNAQLFSVFGSPRAALQKIEDGLFTVTLEGVDIYNPVDNTILATPVSYTHLDVYKRQGLRGEGVEPVLVNWALHREIRIVNALAFARSQRQPLDPVFAAYKVWDKRKPPLHQTLQRLTLADCRRVLSDCARTDRIIKGMEPGSAWDALLANGLRLAGIELFAEAL